jgi:hypothetical protein
MWTLPRLLGDPRSLLIWILALAFVGSMGWIMFHVLLLFQDTAELATVALGIPMATIIGAPR